MKTFGFKNAVNRGLLESLANSPNFTIFFMEGAVPTSIEDVPFNVNDASAMMLNSLAGSVYASGALSTTDNTNDSITFNQVVRHRLPCTPFKRTSFPATMWIQEPNNTYAVKAPETEHWGYSPKAVIRTNPHTLYQYKNGQDYLDHDGYMVSDNWDGQVFDSANSHEYCLFLTRFFNYGSNGLHTTGYMRQSNMSAQFFDMVFDGPITADRWHMLTGNNRSSWRLYRIEYLDGNDTWQVAVAGAIISEVGYRLNGEHQLRFPSGAITAQRWRFRVTSWGDNNSVLMQYGYLALGFKPDISAFRQIVPTWAIINPISVASSTTNAEAYTSKGKILDTVDKYQRYPEKIGAMSILATVGSVGSGADIEVSLGTIDTNITEDVPYLDIVNAKVKV